MPQRLALLVVLLGLVVGLLVWRRREPRVGGVEAGRPPETAAAVREAPPATYVPSSPSLAPAPDGSPTRPTLGPAARRPHYPREDVEGLVVDAEDGTPIVGALVVGRGPRGDEDWAQTHTDRLGRYVLPLPGWTSYATTVGVHADGYAPRTIDFADRTPHARLPVARLDRVRAWIPGRAVDVLGRPVGGAFVRVGSMEPPYETSADGRFGPVPVGTHDLTWQAWSPRHALTRDEWELEVKTLPARLEVRLAVADPVAGVVVDAQGRPVANADVWQEGTVGACHVRTAADGTFAFPLRVGATETLVAATADALGRAEAYGGGRVRIVLEAGGDLRWPCAAPPAPGQVIVHDWEAVRLRALDGEGRPLAGASVWAEWTDPSGRVEEVTDLQGRCRLRLPAARPVTILVHHHAGWAGRVDVPAGGTAATDLEDLRLHPVTRRPRRLEDHIDGEDEEAPEPCRASGRVLDAGGRPFPGVDVRTPEGAFDVTAEDGTFRIEGESGMAGTTLVVDAPGHLLHEREVATGSTDVSIRLPARGAIRWRLRGGRPEDDGAIAYRIWAAPRREDPALPRGLGPHAALLCLEGETLRLDCPAGRLAVALRVEPGPWVFHPDVAVPADGEVVFDYDFAPLGRLEGFVRDPDGVPVRNAWIRVATLDETIERTDAQGRFVLGPDDTRDALPAGRCRLRVGARTHASCVTQAIDLRADQRLDVTLPRGVVLRGVVLDAHGAPADAAIVHVPEVGPPWQEAFTGADGRFAFEEPLPEGTVRLRIRVEGRADQEVTTEVRDGDLARIVLR